MIRLVILVVVSSLLMSCNDKATTTEAPANTADILFDNSTTYIQFPNTWKDVSGTPVEQIFATPCELSLTGMWEVKNFDGAFFRSEGGLSNGFNAGFMNSSGIFVANRTDIQLDAFQAHRHGMGFAEDEAGSGTGGGWMHTETSEGSYGTKGYRTLKNDVATAPDPNFLTDDSVRSPEGAVNTAPRVATETRPLNYTARVWQKLNSTDGGCAMYEAVYDTKIIEKQVITKDKAGNVIKTEMVVDRVEKTPRLTSSGEVILKEIASYTAEEQAELVKEFASKRQKFVIDKTATDITSKEMSPKVETIIQE